MTDTAIQDTERENPRRLCFTHASPVTISGMRALAQLRAMHEYCSKLDAIVVTKYIYRVKSAATDDLPEFLRMINDAKNEEFDFVIVHKLDHFSRNRYDFAHYRHELKKHNIRLISVIEHLDDNPEGIIMESVLDGMSEYYSRNLSREVMKGMKESALQGLATGGAAPFGLAIDSQTRKHIINEEEVPAIRFIFEQVSNGVGYTRIIQQLLFSYGQEKLAHLR